MIRLAEFFQDGDGRLSMTRLLSFLSFFPASSVLAVSHTDTALTIYLTAYVAQYGGSKWIDMKGRMKNAVSKPHSR